MGAITGRSREHGGRRSGNAQLSHQGQGHRPAKAQSSKTLLNQSYETTRADC